MSDTEQTTEEVKNYIAIVLQEGKIEQTAIFPENTTIKELFDTMKRIGHPFGTRIYGHSELLLRVDAIQKEKEHESRLTTQSPPDGIPF